ncbi:MAG TPA: lysine 2,3-aminomutase [Porphyromonadaceae bacterium]|jgi:KamA family protein|nr:lysine 2,3-aminomutase [Porphyromonadaceae bacterium]HBL32972.1 lysine 2,3-aminomutase [Porphyromonadaceae bacterium]HBX20159.1 lysine 2,3-aminomutase [Porphyromonadaceae bacterium]HCM22146.1 lysine 2,3-aminomutase [Porphyromonadaceae bacterium]
MPIKKYKTYTLQNFDQLPQIIGLSEEFIEPIRTVGQVLPFRANNYVVEELIDWSNIPEDPIFTLTFPRKEMLSKTHYNKVRELLQGNVEREVVKKTVNDIRMKLNPNPAGQEHNVPTFRGKKLNGMQHKYRETVLFFPSQGQTCHAYCTFCFRWTQFSGMNDFKFAMKEADLLHDYLRHHKQVTDILFTGGDPLTARSKILSTYIEPLLTKEFSHIRNIRIGSKTLAYWPYRFLNDKDADELLRLFEKITKAGKHLAFQAHFSHPVELSTDAVKKAIERIRNTGAQIRTQSPVLKHINADPKIWSAMWKEQVRLGLIPYYMFVARDTGAKAFFEIPIEKAWNIFRKAYASVSGICRTVRGPSMSAFPGKIEILGVTEVKEEKVFVLRFLQCRNRQLVDIPFFATYDPKASWYDQLKPAFGEKEFFFQKDNLLGKDMDDGDFLWE